MIFIQQLCAKEFSGFQISFISLVLPIYLDNISDKYWHLNMHGLLWISHTAKYDLLVC